MSLTCHPEYPQSLLIRASSRQAQMSCLKEAAAVFGATGQQVTTGSNLAFKALSSVKFHTPCLPASTVQCQLTPVYVIIEQWLCQMQQRKARATLNMLKVEF